MEGTDESSASQLLQSSFSTFSSLFSKQPHHKQLEIPNLNTSQNVSPESNKTLSGVPPSPLKLPISSPYLQIALSQPTPHQPINQNLGLGISHSRSSSQPSFFSMNCLPLLNPSPTSCYILPNVSMDDQADCSQGSALAAPLKGNSFRARERIPPHKAHRRSISDVPLGFSAMIQSSPQLIPISGQGVCHARDNLGGDKPVQPVKQELDSDMDHLNNAEAISKIKPERGVVDDLLVTYMKLDNIDTLHSSATEDKDMDTRASGTKSHGGDNSDNEVESGMKGYPNNMCRAGLSFSTERSEGVERIGGGDIALTARHFRSVSMDSFLGNLNIAADESTKLSPLLGTGVSQYSPSNSMDGDLVKFSLEFGNGEFSRAELKKIMANEKLAEIALSDPKRVKRILANRQSAARSKERKMRYISELEHKVQTLQSEATTLSAQLSLLQRESAGLSGQNNELKFRLQALEQQAQLKDALNEALTAEVHRLKLEGAELRGEIRSSDSLTQQTCMNIQMFSMQN